MASVVGKKDDSLKKLLGEAKELYNSSVSFTEQNLEQIYGLNKTFLEESLMYPVSTLKEMSDEDITKVYQKYFIGDQSMDYLPDPKDQREALLDAKEMANQVFETKDQFEDIQKTYAEAVDAEWAAKNSKEHRQHEMDVLAHLREDVEKETDVRRKKDLLHKIEVMESTMTLDFILQRISTITEQEMNSVMRQFFSQQEGSYIIERCNAKSKRFGYEVGWYKAFFNLEEKFLPEEYHVYNNLFLYAVMRFFGYADPYRKEDQAYVHALINSLTGVVYHKFTDDAVEKLIINLIETYDDYYSEYREKFEQDNTTHPNHPTRINYSKKAEADRKNTLLESLVKFNIPVPENVDEMSARDLHKYFNDEMDKLIAKNREDTKETHGGAEVSTDGETTTIKPSFNRDKYKNPVDIIDEKFYYLNDDNFTEFHNKLKDEGIVNNRFMLELKNPDVPTENVWNREELTEEDIAAAQTEAAENFWYWVRFVARLDNMREVQLSGLNSIFWLTALNSKKPIVVSATRQTGRTTMILLYMKWLEMYHRATVSFDTKDILAKYHTEIQVPEYMAGEAEDDSKIIYYVSENTSTLSTLKEHLDTDCMFVDLRYKKEYWDTPIQEFILKEHKNTVISSDLFDSMQTLSEESDVFIVEYFLDDMLSFEESYWNDLIDMAEEPSRTMLLSDATGVPVKKSNPPEPEFVQNIKEVLDEKGTRSVDDFLNGTE